MTGSPDDRLERVLLRLEEIPPWHTTQMEAIRELSDEADRSAARVQSVNDTLQHLFGVLNLISEQFVEFQATQNRENEETRKHFAALETRNAAADVRNAQADLKLAFLLHWRWPVIVCFVGLFVMALVSMGLMLYLYLHPLLR